MEDKLMDNTKKQKRINAVPDVKLLNMLKSGDQSALQLLLSDPTIEGLAAIEETIALYSGNSDPMFYKLGGQRIYSSDSAADAIEKITDLVMDDKLLNDPAYSQFLIAGVGESNSNFIMNQLRMYPQKLYDYQLLGVQMQLAYLLRDKIESSQSPKTHTAAEERNADTKIKDESLSETVEKAMSSLEQNMLTLLDTIDKSIERASKKDMLSYMTTLVKTETDTNFSLPVRKKANKVLGKALDIAKAKYPQLYENLQKGGDMAKVQADNAKNYNNAPSTSAFSTAENNSSSSKESRKKAVALAFTVGFVSAIASIISTIISYASSLGSDYPMTLGLLVFSIILSMLPIGIAFIAKKNLKVAGILFIVFGALGLISALPALFGGTLSAIIGVAINILYIVAGVTCNKASKE